MRKIILLSSIFLISTISIVLFIKFSNDHIECIQKNETKRNSNGDIVTIKSHICNEKYNF